MGNQSIGNQSIGNQSIGNQSIGICDVCVDGAYFYNGTGSQCSNCS
jgi:hypothetical protein